MWQPFARFKRDACSETGTLLSGYVDRRLNPEEQARVEEHLGGCRRCREELESLRAAVALLRSLPEVEPSRSFAVAPTKPLPGRAALPALRFAVAAVVLLLVGTLAVDQTNLLVGDRDTGSYLGAISESNGERAYWTVDGLKNTIIDPATDSVETKAVTLVVPDGSDNAVMAVSSLAAANDGVLCGNIFSTGYDETEVVLAGGEDQAAVAGDVEKFAVVDVGSDNQSRFATNGYTGEMDEWDAKSVPTLSFNMVPLDSGNAVLYSFNLDEAQLRLAEPADDDRWLRPMEYSLVGLAAILAGAAAVLWFRQRKAKALQAIKIRD